MQSASYDVPTVAELYDHVPLYLARSDVPFYVSRARAGGGAVLELGCGTGRVLIPTAAAGCEIVGIDSSRHMLARCREKLERLPVEVRARARVAEGDMTRLDLGARFALITIPFRAFQHLTTTDEQLACLACVRRHLAPGGRLVLDVFHPDMRRLTDPAREEEIEDTPSTPLTGGRSFRRTVRIAELHSAGQYSDVEIIYYLTHADGHVERLVQAFPFRYFWRFELEHLLARARLSTVALHGDFDGSPFGDASSEIIVEAEAS